MVICSFCGKNNREESRFCYNCGKPLRNEPVKVKVLLPVLKASSSFMIKPPPRMITAIGMCYYHPNLPAAYICARCGRAICRYCAKPYGALVFCPECFSRISFIQPAIQAAPVYPFSSTFQSPPSSFL
jgi:DNA-directed RNA polymerase subunit RPC12/RpoP